MPPKQACVRQQVFKSPCSDDMIVTHGAGEHEYAPSVDLWGILLDGIVVDDLVENTHVVGRSFCRAQTCRLELLGGETGD
jgi:hypothetical protein